MCKDFEITIQRNSFLFVKRNRPAGLVPQYYVTGAARYRPYLLLPAGWLPTSGHTPLCPPGLGESVTGKLSC